MTGAELRIRSRPCKISCASGYKTGSVMSLGAAVCFINLDALSSVSTNSRSSFASPSFSSDDQMMREEE